VVNTICTGIPFEKQERLELGNTREGYATALARLTGGRFLHASDESSLAKSLKLAISDQAIQPPYRITVGLRRKPGHLVVVLYGEVPAATRPIPTPPTSGSKRHNRSPAAQDPSRFGGPSYRYEVLDPRSRTIATGQIGDAGVRLPPGEYLVRATTTPPL